MKNLILLFIFLVVTVTSCNVLDVKPQSGIKASLALSNKRGIEKAVLGTYDAFQSLSYYGRVFTIFPDLGADNLIHPVDATSAEYGQIANDHILTDNLNVEGLWAIMYDGINRANSVIAAIPNVADMSAADKAQALGEMYFTRALNYFNLVSLFGAVPLITEPTLNVNNANVPRNSVADVYTQILSDLTFAEQNLSAGSSKILASKYAATALLARIYLFKGDYANAITKATDVIDNGGYVLVLADSNVYVNENTTESIFEIDFTALDRNRIAEYNFPKPLNGRREVAPSPGILTAYEPGDTRKAASIGVSGTQYYARKYNNIALGSENVLVLRLAEMYLIRAEALAKSNGAISDIQDDIDVIRTRAHLTGTSASTYPELLDAIAQENRVEFAFEGHRWFDLIRTGTAIDVLPNVTNANQLLYPIPIAEMTTNKDPGMTQNPGY